MTGIRRLGNKKHLKVKSHNKRGKHTVVSRVIFRSDQLFQYILNNFLYFILAIFNINRYVRIAKMHVPLD